MKFGTTGNNRTKYGYDRYGYRHRNRPFDDYEKSNEKKPDDGEDQKGDKPKEGPYDDPTTGKKVAYDEYSRLLKPGKQKKQKRPFLSRNTKAKLWSKGVGIAASLLGLGGAAAAAASMAADPREREAALMGNVDQKAAPLREPSGDDRSTFQKLSDRMTKFQTGHDDYYGNDFDDDDYDDEYDRRVRESVVREAVKTMDDNQEWYDDTELESICDRIGYAMANEFYNVEDNGDHFIVTDGNGNRFKVSVHVERMDADE